MPYDNMLIETVIAACIIMIASLGGVIFINKGFSAIIKRNLKILIAFSGGIFLVIVYSLFSEVLELGIELYTLIFSAIAGALMLEIIVFILPRSHHHHDTEHAHAHSRIDARRMLLGDAIHNIGDGIVLVPAFAAGLWIGVATTLAIFLHELTQEIAEFFVLKEAGYSTKRALLSNFAVSSTIFIGVALSFLLVSVATIEGPLLAFAGGAFLYIVLRDLLPSIIRAITHSGGALKFVLATLAGMALMLLISTIAH